MGKKSKRARAKGKGKSPINNDVQPTKLPWGVRTIAERDAALIEYRAFGYTPPDPPVGSLPNPRLWVKPTASACKHGCQIAAKNVTQEEMPGSMIHSIIVCLNMGIDGLLGPVNCPGELKFRTVGHAKELSEEHIRNFDEVWFGNGDESKKLASGLTSIGTDCLLIDGGVDRDGQLKMAAALAGMIRELEIGGDATVEESIKKVDDTLFGSERQIVGFFKRRISCDCLTSKYKVLKESQQKIGKCYGCGKTFELEELKECSNCQLVQYCSKSCQVDHWSEHKTMCTHSLLSLALDMIKKNVVSAVEGRDEDAEDDPDILGRLHVEACKDPAYRKRYSRVLDMDKIYELTKKFDEVASTEAPPKEKKKEESESTDVS